jgi:hypothetical protein
MDWAGEVLVAVTGKSLGDYFEGELNCFGDSPANVSDSQSTSSNP